MQKDGPERVIVITGASSGIGRATAHRFARRGNSVALLARGHEGLKAAAREVSELGGRPLVIPTDVADADAVEHAADRAERELGPIDVWINDAAVCPQSPVLQMEPAEFEQTMRVNYLGTVHGSLSAARRMVRRDRGTIVQIGSALAHRGIPLLSAYCASQHAIVGFSESFRTELMHDGSRVWVTMVHPSGVNTPLWQHNLTRMSRLPRPMERIFQPEVIAKAVEFASNRRRREVWVGYPAAKAIIGNRIAGWYADKRLAKTGYEGQLSEHDVDPTRPHNLWQGIQGDPGVHGPYDDRAWGFSVQSAASRHRNKLALAAAGVAAGIGLLAASRRSDRW